MNSHMTPPRPDVIRGRGPRPLKPAELQTIIDRHDGKLTEAFHRDILLAQGFEGRHPWANETFDDPVLNAYLMERYKDASCFH